MSVAQNGIDYQVVHEKFCEWLATPKLRKNPRTQKEFAALYGVSENHLSNLKKKPETWREVKRITRADLIQGDAPDIMKALVDRAKDGSIGHIKLFIEVTGYHFKDDLQPEEEEHTRPEPISSEDLDEQIRRLLKETETSRAS